MATIAAMVGAAVASTVAPLISFLDAPVQTDLTRLEADFAFLGIPFGSPYDMRGVHGESATAPTALREASWEFEYAKVLEHYDFDLDGPLIREGLPRLIDCGDVAGDPRDLRGTAEAGTAAVRQIVEGGAVPVVIGGDDSLPLIVARALEGRGPLRVLQIDAHLDFRDEINGVRDGLSSSMRRLRDLNFVDAIYQVGLRGAGSARQRDYEAALAAGNVLIPARELHEQGALAVLERLPQDGQWFVTVDCDGLDPSIAPGTGYPEPNGVTFPQALTFIQGMASKRRTVALEFTEYWPRYDVRSITALTLIRLIVNFMGASHHHSEERPDDGH